MNDRSISWRDIWCLYPKLIWTIKTLLIILSLDIILSLSLSTVLSDSFYFEKYSSFRLWQGTSSYNDITKDFFGNTYKLTTDDSAGWVNSSNYTKEGLLWSTGYLGNRVPPEQEKIERPSSSLQDDNLVLLIGSSVLSGYNLSYKQAPVNLLNKDGYRALSFGTIMYSIDQTYEFYKKTLSQYKPKVLVVGIHNDLDVISNMFVPFRIHDMSVPFLKPAYYLTDNHVTKTLPPVENQRNKDFSNMLIALKKNDSHYYKFQVYKGLSLLPFSDMLRKLIMKVEQEIFDVDAYVKAFKLQEYFMGEIVNLAKKNGTEVIFVKFETKEDQEKSLYKRFFKDRNTIHNELLKRKQVNIIYTSEMFKENGRPLSDFYQGYDTVHFSAIGCKLLAETIHQKINNIKLKQ